MKFELEVERLEPLGSDRVLAACTWKATGLPAETANHEPYELEDGRLSRVRGFFDRAEAPEVAGLLE